MKKALTHICFKFQFCVVLIEYNIVMLYTAAFDYLPRPVVDELSQNVLRMNISTILKHADQGDVFLDCVLDELISRPEPIISDAQKQDIKAQQGSSQQRFRKLLDYLRNGGLAEFIEFCNAIDCFRNLSSHTLATELRKTLEKQCAEWWNKEIERIRGEYQIAHDVTAMVLRSLLPLI